MIAVQMVMFSGFDLDTFLPIARQALGRGVSAKADNQMLPLELHNMTCVAGLVGGEAGDADLLYSMAYLVAADERDMPAIVQAAGMPHLGVDSQTRGVRVVLISGPMPGWRDALRRGCSAEVGVEVRRVYNLIYKDLTRRSLDGILKVVKRHPQQDATFLLEFKA